MRLEVFAALRDRYDSLPVLIREFIDTIELADETIEALRARALAAETRMELMTGLERGIEARTIERVAAWLDGEAARHTHHPDEHATLEWATEALRSGAWKGTP
jgi:hypothetical protein